MEEIGDAIPGARLEVIEGAGHFPYLERPQRTSELIRGFAA
jgi:pimeloyl-ACP methyl ester carboxylesterase